MNDIAIRVEKISKQYNIDNDRFKYLNLRDHLGKMLKQSLCLGQARPGQDKFSKTQYISALKDVSFDIEQGEAVGIIGRNGAGKTTLLKILSRITKPTKGYAEICGRASSLLEVGTGFHEELTGRENIYLNGAILGMKKCEIKRKFDEIVEFAEIDKFLDMPIKYYSSGMFVRLAFSVAAHLENDILFIDEILSVGDVRFQRKCLNKIGNELCKQRTVLFVSHNMSMVNALCSRVILLDKGRVAAAGDKEKVIKKYISDTHKMIDVDLSLRSDRAGSGVIRFKKYRLEDNTGERTNAFKSGEESIIAVDYASVSGKKMRDVSVSFVLHDFLGNPITDLANRVSGEIWPEISSKGTFKCHIKKLPLMPGIYTFNVFASVNGVVADSIKDAGMFEVEAGFFFPSGRLTDSGLGAILIENEWSACE